MNIDILNSLTVPILLALAGFLIGFIAQTVNRQWQIKDRVAGKRLEIYEKIGEDLNRIYCYVMDVGDYTKDDPISILAAKRTGEDAYTVYDVVGWRSRYGQPVVRIFEDIPDRFWYGAKPRVLQKRQGHGVDELIEAVDRAARAYPWKNTYKLFPGPNSNTFTAWIAKQVPELHLELPLSAIGSGYVN